MRIALLGATGGTGRAFLDQALDRRHAVTALVRPAETLPVEHPALTVVRGDALDAADVSRTVAAADAVVSVLGTGDSVARTTLYSRGIAILLPAMKQAGVGRLVAVTSSGVAVDPDDPWWFRVLQCTYFRRLFADMRTMEVLTRTSATDWTIVRPTRLTDGALTGRYRTAVERNAPPGGRRISRADLAHLLLSVAEDGTALHQAISVAY